MAKVTWTSEQQKVIDLRDRNILVSAAAGSGKTAVLVERIIKMITEGDKPIDIDQLLIVTFTKAAAAEMKERIGARIEKKLKEMPANEHLQKQMTLIHSAQITTIHSFCLYIIRNYFNSIDLDPSFRVADEAEIKLLKSDAIAEILEQHYDEANKEFISFIESYSSSKSDEVVEELILQLYNFSMSYPWPEQWLNEIRKLYEISSLEEMEQTDWMCSFIDYIHSVLKDIALRNEEAIRICLEADGPVYYEDALQSDKELLQDLLKKSRYVEFEKILKDIKFARLSTKKMPDASDLKKDNVKAIREDIKKTITDLRKNYFFQPASEMLLDIQNVKQVMNVLIDLTIEFLRRFSKEKEEKSIVDFNDLEHFALNILVDKGEDGVVEPTNVANLLSEHFEEILIDEYQDSNLVQETILTSISKERFGRPNVFMVGDVKQSIYKFRLARPELFLEKYETYSVGDSDHQRIDLHKNFRSRSVVLDSVNFICEQIMTKGLGNIDYNDEVALYAGAIFKELRKVHIDEVGEQLDQEVIQNQDSIPKMNTIQNQKTIQERVDSKKINHISDSTELILVPLEKNSLNDSTDGEGNSNLASKEKYLEKGASTLEDEEELSKKELEARAIASRIREITSKELGIQVLDKSGEYRLAEFKDIVILLRTMNNWADIFVDTLMAEGIPAYSDTQSGYFSSLEIKTILNMLNIIDNPRQDIPLAAVLHSPIVLLTTKELAFIRANAKDVDLYDAIVIYSCNGENEELRERVEHFLNQLDELRKMVPYTNVHQLILKVLDSTKYYYYVKAMPAGDRRSANIDMLVQKAIEFEQTSYHGLFNFIRYIEKLHKYDIDFGEAKTIGENDNTVRIMSIHKSKGLEFPIVFVSGLGKSFNNQDARSKIVIHPDLGLGPDYIDYELRMKAPTLIKKVIQKKMQLENLGEELRILYVALTRAKEKLILTGTIKEMAATLKKYQSIVKQEEKKHLFHYLSSASNYLDWVIPALLRHPSFEEILLENQIYMDTKHPYYSHPSVLEVKVADYLKLTSSELVKQIAREVHKEELLSFDTNKVYNQAVRQEIEKRLNFEYQYKGDISIHAKITVTELKKLGQKVDDELSEHLFEEDSFLEEENLLKQRDSNDLMQSELVMSEDEEDISKEPSSQELELEDTIPRFISEEPIVTATSRGTLYHKVLECIDLSKINQLEDVEKELERLVEEERIQSSDLSVINAYQIYCFAISELAKRMKKAKSDGKLFLEKQFVLGIKANEINNEIFSNEIVLIQGIIDVYFEEEDGIVLMDYKTDHIKKGQEDILIGRYRLQLEYYQRAIEQILKKKVKEKIIYSFALNKSIRFI